MDNIKDDEVKKVILEAAKRIFQKWGLNKSTMEDIAKEAGKGKSTLYYYYKSKEEIFDSVVKDEIKAIHVTTRKSIEGITNAKDKLRNYIVVSLTTMKKHLIVYDIVRGEIKGNKELLEKIKKQIYTEEEIFIKNILAGGVKTSELTFIDEKELNDSAKVIVGMVSAMELYLFLESEDLELIDIAAKFISNGI